MCPLSDRPPSDEARNEPPSAGEGHTELIARLVQLADDLTPLAPPVQHREQLSAICATARLVLGAAAVSVAQLSDEENGGLHYVAADGEGASAVIDMALSPGEGLAGFVVATGQSLVIDRVGDDPRFSRDVAESTGYVPSSMLVVPVLSSNGSVLGVLSVLDRNEGATSRTADALELATMFAQQAGTVLAHLDMFVRLGPLLLAGFASAVEQDDYQIADGLRRVAASPTGGDSELAEIAALLADLRRRPSSVRASALRVIRELVALTASGRTR